MSWSPHFQAQFRCHTHATYTHSHARTHQYRTLGTNSIANIKEEWPIEDGIVLSPCQRGLCFAHLFHSYHATRHSHVQGFSSSPPPLSLFSPFSSVCLQFVF